MDDFFKGIFTSNQLLTLASIVEVGDSAYRELMETQHSMFGHSFFTDTRGRIRTKIVQMQAEIESHDPAFPFEYCQREFQYKSKIPELRNGNAIIHIARSVSPDVLPYQSNYKIDLSNNNNILQRQLMINADHTPPYGFVPLYAILVFGGSKHTFSAIQFPEPGYGGIAAQISLPQIGLVFEKENKRDFERKKAVLKKELLAHKLEEEIS